MASSVGEKALSNRMKKTCEACTLSKVACSGPVVELAPLEATAQPTTGASASPAPLKICERCKARGTVCLFLAQKRRGPLPGGGHTMGRHTAKRVHAENEGDDAHRRAKRTTTTTAAAAAAGRNQNVPPKIDPEKAKREFAAKLTFYERRCISIFFTLLKQQFTPEGLDHSLAASLSLQQKDSSARSEPLPASAYYTWCWFASQLAKVKKNWEERNNVGALRYLETWTEKVNMTCLDDKIQSRCKCTVPPHFCNHCSIQAIGEAQEIKAQIQAAPLAERLVAPSPGAEAAALSDSDPYPRAVVEICADVPTKTTLNKKFREIFGFKEGDFDGTCPFTTGFLPWGGDFLCRMLLTEAEVTTFLRIMAIKFGSAGPVVIKHDQTTATRDLASVHVFNMVRRDPNADPRGEIRSPLEWPSEYINCLAKVVHRETVKASGKTYPDKVKMQVIFTFEPLSEVLTYNHQLYEQEFLVNNNDNSYNRYRNNNNNNDEIESKAESHSSTPSLTTTGASLSTLSPSSGLDQNSNLEDEEWEGGDEEGIMGEDDLLNHQGGDEEWMATLLEWVETGESPLSKPSSSSFE